MSSSSLWCVDGCGLLRRLLTMSTLLCTLPHLFPTFQLVVVPSPICCIHIFRGRPGSLRQFIPKQRPAFIAMTCFKAWCAGMLVSSLTTCPNSAWRFLSTMSVMFGRPVVSAMSTFFMWLMCYGQCPCALLHMLKESSCSMYSNGTALHAPRKQLPHMLYSMYSGRPQVHMLLLSSCSMCSAAWAPTDGILHKLCSMCCRSSPAAGAARLLHMLWEVTGTFVPAYFRSRERKFHRWNFRSLELSLPGTFAPVVQNLYFSLPHALCLGL